MKLYKIIFPINDGLLVKYHAMIIKADSRLDAHELFMKFIRSNLKDGENLDERMVNIFELQDDIRYVYCDYESSLTFGFGVFDEKFYKIFFTINDGHHLYNHILILKAKDKMEASNIFMKFAENDLKYGDKLHRMNHLIEVPDDANYIYCSYKAS